MNDESDQKRNIFSEMKVMIASSLGRIPAFLVVIFMTAVTVSVLSGFFLHLATENKSAREFMPLRIEADQNAAPIDVKKLKGHWVVQSTSYAMSFTFVQDRFEWIVIMPEFSGTQFYARGNFRIVGDVLILGVRPDLGKPYDFQKPWIKYMPMAMKDLNLKIHQEGKSMVWDVPLSEQKKILSHTAEIFLDGNNGRFQWVRR